VFASDYLEKWIEMPINLSIHRNGPAKGGNYSFHQKRRDDYAIFQRMKTLKNEEWVRFSG